MKKKLLFISIIACLMLVSAAAGAYAATQMRITVNGKSTSIAPTLIDNKAYLPLRDMANLLGIDINYIKETNTIELKTSNPNAMPDPITSSSKESQSNGILSQEETDAANRIFFIIGGVSDIVRAAKEGKRTKEEVKEQFLKAKKSFDEASVILYKSKISQVVNFVSTAGHVIMRYEDYVAGGDMTKDKQLQISLQVHTDAHLQLSKMLLGNSVIEYVPSAPNLEPEEGSDPEWLPNPRDLEAAQAITSALMILKDTMMSYHNRDIKLEELTETHNAAKEIVKQNITILKTSLIPDVITLSML